MLRRTLYLERFYINCAYQKRRKTFLIQNILAFETFKVRYHNYMFPFEKLKKNLFSQKEVKIKQYLFSSGEKSATIPYLLKWVCH